MKGIIAEVHGSYMIVIAKNGDFIKCKRLPNCDIGDEVNIPAKNMNTIYKKISTIAASFIILTMLSSGVYAYYTPYSYVSVDINPSLELSVNRFEKVIGIHAFNEDAEKVLAASPDIKNKDIDIALEKILDSAADKGYLKKNEENSVMIVVSSKSEKEEAALTNKISETSAAALSKVSSTYEVILEKTKVANYKKAKKENVSPGKVILANELKEVKPDIDEDKIKHMPLKQVIKEIEKKDNKDDKAEGPKPEVQKPVVNNDKPKLNDNKKGNIKNVEELIKEKNEELGKKLEQIKNKNKKNDGESFNNNDKNNNKQKNSKVDNNTGQNNDKQYQPQKEDKKNN